MGFKITDSFLSTMIIISSHILKIIAINLIFVFYRKFCTTQVEALHWQLLFSETHTSISWGKSCLLQSKECTPANSSMLAEKQLFKLETSCQLEPCLKVPSFATWKRRQVTEESWPEHRVTMPPSYLTTRTPRYMSNVFTNDNLIKYFFCS